MDLSPEHLDRHPFRIRKRGYDIMQVRKLLREVGEELRARQQVKDEIGEADDPRAMAEREALEIVARAESRADEIIADAEDNAVRPDSIADEVIAVARAEAVRLIEDAEATARERCDVVIAEAQARLDRLIDQERDLATRLRHTEHRLRELSGPEREASHHGLRPRELEDGAEVIDLTAVPDRTAAESAERDDFADLVKDAVLRDLEAHEPA